MKISIVAFRLIRKAFVLCTRQYANMLQKKKPDENLAFIFS